MEMLSHSSERTKHPKMHDYVAYNSIRNTTISTSDSFHFSKVFQTSPMSLHLDPMFLFGIGTGSSVFNHSPLNAFINHFESSIEITRQQSMP